MKALIIGGGIGGLTLSLELLQSGFDVEVYERAERFSPVGAGIMLAPNAMRVFNRLGLAEELRSAGNLVTTTAITDWSGKVISEMGMDSGENIKGSIAIHRSKLHEILASKVGPEKINFSEDYLASEDVPDGVFSLFESGHTAKGDILVGCDGIHSAVRKHLFGAGPLRYSGQMCWRGVAQLDSSHDDSPKNRFVESWGRGLRFGYVNLADNQVYWYATKVQSANEVTSTATRKQVLEGHFSKWHSPIPAIINQTPAQSVMEHPLFDVRPMQGWFRGRACLLGDSIHPTTPNMGQGAGMAIESAAVLAHTLREQSDTDAAFRAYESLRYKRCARVNLDSWRIGQITNWRGQMSCAIRNKLMGMVPSKAGQSRYENFVGADLLGI